MRGRLCSVPHMEPSPSSPPRPAASPRGRAPVKAIARAAGRSCSRPGCDTPPAATLVFSYEEQVARLVDLTDEREPQAYDLCGRHADRTSPPRGWDMADARVPRDESPRRLSDDSTVAVIAAALRGEAPAGRIEVLAGGRVDEAVPATDDAWIDDLDDDADGADGNDDPLRAALEEVQRVAEPDHDAPGAVPAPVRMLVQPDDGPTLW